MQKLITSKSREGFEKQVNELMKQGYTVVPGTLAIAVSSGQNCTNESYGIVLTDDRAGEFEVR
jgi:hypothetical protein